MKNDREFSGTLLGFDDFVSSSSPPISLSPTPPSPPPSSSCLYHHENGSLKHPVSRHGLGGCNGIVRSHFFWPVKPVRVNKHVLLSSFRYVSRGRRNSETTPQGRKTTKLNQTLLNGNNICMVSQHLFTLPGDRPGE